MTMNKNIKVIQTKKYKDINLYLYFSLENKPKYKQALFLLSKLLGEVSINYPCKELMTKYRDMLYGIDMVVNPKSLGNVLYLSVHYDFINPRFLDVSIDDYLTYIQESLFNTLIDEDKLKEAIKTVKSSLTRNNDKPANIAKERFINIVSADNPDFKIYSCDEQFIKSLDDIDLAFIKEVYAYVLNKAMLRLYLCGDLSEDDIKKLSNFNFKNRDKVDVKANLFPYKKHEDVIEHKNISQSYLNCIYSVPYSYQSKNYPTWLLGNVLLGLGPSCLLFLTVREKMSLCYSISSFNYKFNGLVQISTSINGNNLDKVIKAINEQIQRIINQDYDDNILETTKVYLINNLLSLYDDLDGLVDYNNQLEMMNSKYNIEKYIQAFKKINKKDLSKLFKEYKPYFNYCLLGDKHEKTLQ